MNEDNPPRRDCYMKQSRSEPPLAEEGGAQTSQVCTTLAIFHVTSNDRRIFHHPPLPVVPLNKILNSLLIYALQR
jgi:hypothetical protein